MSLIEIKNLRKEYPDVTPLENVSANIEEGDIVSIIGPSGTGKSTLLRCINRLETPTSGSIIVDGVNVCDPDADLPAVRRKMGMVFQAFNLFPHKMVVENIMMPQQTLLGRSPAEAYEEAMEQLRLVGLEAKSRRYPTSSRAGRNSVSRSPGLSLCIRRSCSLTSRPVRSIRRWSPRLSPSCASWREPV